MINLLLRSKLNAILAFALVFCSLPLIAQINGPSTVNEGTTHTYSYTQSELVSPFWQVSGGTKISESYNYMNYQVTVTWGSGPSGGLALLNGGSPITLSVTINAALSAPTASAASNVANTSFTANWGSVSGATNYLLDVSTTSNFSSFLSGYNNKFVSTTNNAVTPLSANTTYYYRVRAQNSSGTSTNSSTITTVTAPNAPSASTASAITVSSFTANWSSVSGAASYRLDVSTSSSFSSFVSGFNNATVAGTTSNVSGLTGGNTYYYRVRAVNSAGSVSANSSSITTLLIPSAPTTTAPTTFTATSFTANWSSTPGASSYRLDVSTSSGFTSFVSGYNNLTVSGTSNSVVGLAAGTTYFYRVRAVNASGTSVNSSSQTSLTISPSPVPMAATGITATSFVANWQSASGASSYRLDVSINADFSSFVASYNNRTVASTSETVTGLAMNTNYFYRVRAVNSSGTSSSSSSVKLDLDHNYIRKVNVLISGLTTSSAVEAATLSQKITSYEFFDGLGRPDQIIVKQGSPGQLDIISAVEYDEYGREAKKYLPYADGTSGWYKENALKDPTTQVNTAGKQYQFYQSGGLVASDTKPFAEARFEPSPLHRIIEQGAPGLAFQPDATNSYTSADHTLKKAYEIVSSTTEVLKWTYTYPTNSSELLGFINAGTAASPVYYGANTLYRNRSKDEDGKEVLQYTDTRGLVILKRVQVATTPSGIDDTQYASTYYIYDDFDNLVCVIPPEATKRLSAEYHHAGATHASKEIFLDRWAFRYRYDERGRLIRKQVPGAGQVFMVYDDRDRLALTQDSVQRAKTPTKEWTFTKYDLYNRPVSTGKYLSNNSLTSMQGAVNTYYTSMPATKAWFETYVGSSGVRLGYDDKSFPQGLTEADYYSAIYYDVYDAYIAPTGYEYTNSSLIDPETSLQQEAATLISGGRFFGQVTGTLLRNLSAATWSRTVNYYDQKYRLVQSITDHQKGKITISNILDFAGKVVYSKRIYVVNSVTTNIVDNPGYDHMGRILWTKHSINGSADIVTTKNEYNELGQLVDKKLHSTTTAGTDAKQSVDYRYNIRGWLVKINEADVAAVASGDIVADHFGMEMAYENLLSGITSTQAYNGNISAIQWSKGAGGTARKQTYTFGYDKMNRLKDASHFDYDLLSSTWISNNNGYDENMTYDYNGNIQTLLRKGFKGSSMDNLSYTYTGNQLDYVNDAADAALGFVNGNSGIDDYSYDVNGNLDKDKNKGIVTKGNIKYNYMNLVEEIVKGTEKIKYIYDATGRKLAQEVYNTSGTLTKTTDYIGEMVYENNVLKIIQHAEGRILPDAANWEYQYHLKDHLGNVRVTFTSKTQTTTTYTTNFEASSNGDFLNYTSQAYDLVDHTDAAGTTYTKVQTLNGGVNGRVGLAKTFQVMPGDQVSISSYCKYMAVGGSNPNAFIAQLASAFGVSSGSTGEQLKIYNGLNSYAGTVTSGNHYNDDDAVPKAFVTILFFDKDYNFIDAAWDQVSSIGAQTSGSVKQPPHDLLSITARAPEAGYAYVFVSNEDPNYVNIYFDDASVSHTPSPIVSTSDYFPFGLAYNSMERQGSLEQKYLYNGKELQDELSVNWYDYGARMYMPEIGRWGVIDPLAEKMTDWAPYNYGFDNPSRFTDPTGKAPEDPKTKKLHNTLQKIQKQVDKINAKLQKLAKDGLTRDEARQVTADMHKLSTSKLMAKANKLGSKFASTGTGMGAKDGQYGLSGGVKTTSHPVSSSFGTGSKNTDNLVSNQSLNINPGAIVMSTSLQLKSKDENNITFQPFAVSSSTIVGTSGVAYGGQTSISNGQMQKINETFSGLPAPLDPQSLNNSYWASNPSAGFILKAFPINAGQNFSGSVEGSLDIVTFEQVTLAGPKDVGN